MLVYLIENLINGKRYIGQTIFTLDARWKQHQQSAQNNSQFPIHCAIRKYGSSSFKTSILTEVTSKEEMDFHEKFYIKNLVTRTPKGYNLTEGGEGSLGRVSTEETRKRISKALKGNKYSLGFKHTKKTREKMSKARKGRGQKKGFKHSLEAKNLIREAAMGRKHTLKTKQKLSKMTIGKKRFLGRKHSDITRQKMSDAAKKRYEHGR
jgi:group I intron endonuclease